jgi:LPXTG-motif cell wall-anchored protein
MKRRWAARATSSGDRRSLRMGSALGILATLGLVAANALSALPASAAAPYPPGGTPTLSVSTTVPAPGQTIIISGTGWGADEVVTLVLHSTPVTLASPLTDGNGAFSVPATIPSDVQGDHVLTATGGTTGQTISITLTISSQPATGGGGGGGLPNTGLMVWGFGIVAVVLLTLGAALVVSGRRRRSAAA